jgi:hypothetical protein
MPIRVCPTYYSDDPVLDRVFGPRPPGYLESLCSQLGQAFEIFWTGPAVCSDSIERTDLAPVAARCNRRLALWDNYPVNDSRARSPHLYLQPLRGRSPDIAAYLGSHWCNAMNQPALSLPALASLPKLYGRLPEGEPTVMQGAGLTVDLLRACAVLAETPLAGLSADQLARLEAAAEDSSPAALELRDWLAGAYEFDPACLTD